MADAHWDELVRIVREEAEKIFAVGAGEAQVEELWDLKERRGEVLRERAELRQRIAEVECEEEEMSWREGIR